MSGRPGGSDLRAQVVEALGRARGRIAAAGGDPAQVEVVAVTKGFGVEEVEAALAAGLASIGENYAAELLGKAELLAATAAATPAGGPAWHYLGSVQRRKVRSLAPVVSLWQSVGRLAEGEEIARRAPGAAVLVEVEATGLPGRPGVPPAGVAPLVGALAALGLSVRGLMTVAGPGGGADAERVFRLVAAIADELSLPVRSMGMSGDLEEAVRAGSTMVRLGTALFGPRPAPRRLAQ